jgi:hypothetical protein
MSFMNAGTLSTVSMISQIGGAVTGAIGSYSSASTQKSNYAAQAAIADTNARIAELGAQSALIQGNAQVAQATMQAGQLRGKQRAAMAANGIDLGQGSAAEILASTEIMKDADKQTLIMNALNSAFGYRMNKLNYQTQAALSRAAGKAISPYKAAMSSLLSSAPAVASAWLQWKDSTGGGNNGTQAPAPVETRAENNAFDPSGFSFNGVSYGSW